MTLPVRCHRSSSDPLQARPVSRRPGRIVLREGRHADTIHSRRNHQHCCHGGVGSYHLAIIGTSAFGDSADLSYRTLDYDVTATANGDLKVTQHIDVKMRERTDSDDNTKPWKQLFQQYTLTPAP